MLTAGGRRGDRTNRPRFGDELSPYSDDSSARPGAGIELEEDAANVLANSEGGHAEDEGYIFVGEALGYQAQNVEFPVAKRGHRQAGVIRGSIIAGLSSWLCRPGSSPASML